MSRCRFVLAILFVLLAASDVVRADAQRFFIEGSRLYTLGQYEKALEAFSRGYILRPAPEFIYNVGQCHRMVGRHKEALAAYKKTLQSGIANRAEVEVLIAREERVLAGGCGGDVDCASGVCDAVHGRCARACKTVADCGDSPCEPAVTVKGLRLCVTAEIPTGLTDDAPVGAACDPYWGTRHPGSRNPFDNCGKCGKCNVTTYRCEPMGSMEQIFPEASRQKLGWSAERYNEVIRGLKECP